MDDLNGRMLGSKQVADIQQLLPLLFETRDLIQKDIGL